MSCLFVLLVRLGRCLLRLGVRPPRLCRLSVSVRRGSFVAQTPRRGFGLSLSKALWNIEGVQSVSSDFAQPRNENGFRFSSGGQRQRPAPKRATVIRSNFNVGRPGGVGQERGQAYVGSARWRCECRDGESTRTRRGPNSKMRSGTGAQRPAPVSSQRALGEPRFDGK